MEEEIFIFKFSKFRLFFNLNISSFRGSIPCKKKDMEELGYEEFLLRLWIIPHSDPKLAQLTLVALPLPDVNNAVDAHHAKGGHPGGAVWMSMCASRH